MIAQPGAPLTPEASTTLTTTETATETAQVTGTVGIVTDTLVLDTLLVLDIPQEIFENAPGFDDDLLVLTDPATVNEIEGFYQSLGEDVTVQTIELTDLAAMQSTAIMLGDLLGSNVQNPAEEDLGEIEDLLIRLSDGQVIYVVLSFGGFLGIGDNTYAVPMERIRVVPAVAPGDVPMLLLDVTEEQLETVPTFDEVDLNDFTWDEEVRSYWLSQEE